MIFAIWRDQNYGLRIILLLLLLVFQFFTSSAQEITVYDLQTQERIPGVSIRSNDGKTSLIADNQGRFRLEPFYNCDSVRLSYSSYRTKVYAVNDLKKMSGVYLSDAVLPLSEMRVIANRSDKERLNVPGKVEKIDVKNSWIMAPQTSADLLESSGYVFVQKSQMAGGSPQIRGFGTNRVLIVVDGVRMNNAIFRSGNLQNIISIDPLSLEESEVIFGPGSVVFGSDAIGGVMDFETKKGIYSSDQEGKLLVKNRMYQRYSSSSNELTSHYDLTLGKRKWRSYTALTFSRFSDLRTGQFGDSAFLRPSFQTGTIENQTNMANSDPTLQVGSGYQQFNLLHNVSVRPGEDHELLYGFQYARTGDAARYDRLILDEDENDTLDFFDWYYGPQVWMMHRLEFNSLRTKKLHDKLRLNLAYQRFEESRHDLRSGSTTYRRQFEQVDALSFNVDLVKTLDTNWTFRYGSEFVLNQIGSTAYREKLNGEKMTINSRYPDGSLWYTAGVYWNGEYQLNKKWHFETGVRYSLFGMQAEFDTSLFAYPIVNTSSLNSALNGSVGVIYKSGSASHLYLNLSTGFRAPNIDDLGKVFDSEPGRVVVPNPSIRSEYAYNAETGFVQSIGQFLRLDGSFYYTYLDDALVRSK